MAKIKLLCEKENRMTVVSNTFIDLFMPSAKPLYVKVYLYMLRIMGDSEAEVSVSAIADTLDETEGDILRALNYWESVKLISVSRDETGALAGITFFNPDEVAQAKRSESTLKISTNAVSAKKSAADSFTEAASETGTAPEEPAEFQADIKPNYTKAQIDRLREMDEVHELCEAVENTLGRPLKPSEVQLTLYLFEMLGMSSELIVYLYSYCIEKNKRSVSYVEKVALSWVEKGISTVAQAKADSSDYLSTTRCVAAAFGLHRSLSAVENEYVSRWFEFFGFTEELVREACSRTVLRTGKTDFKYADRILENWSKANIKTMEEVSRADAEHENAGNVRAFPSGRSVSARKTSYNSFPQRNYSEDDLISMEQRLLNR